MRNNLILMFGILFFWVQTGKAQQDTTKNFSLKEAVDFAKKYNVNLLNSKLDQESAHQKVNEIRAIGLPQVNASANIINNLVIGSNVIVFGGQQMVIKFGTPYSSNLSVTASQLLFDGTFFTGLKASKEFVNLTTLNINRTEIETEITISKLYYLCLLFESREKMTVKNIESIKKSKNDIEQAYKNGMVEKLDVDRLKLQLSNLTLEKDKIHDAQLLNLMYLKFQMGLKADAALVLTDKIEDLYDKVKDEIPAEKADYNSRVEYKMLKQTLSLNNLDKKRYNMGYFPSVSAFFQAQQNSFGQNNINDLYKTMYPGTAIGISLNLPIFDGLRKFAQAQQANISIRKTENDIKNFENVIDQQLFLARTNMLRSRTQIDNQKENMNLAQEIYDKTQLKYSNGLGSSLELTMAQSELNSSITNFLSTVYDYFVAELELKKSLGNIK